MPLNYKIKGYVKMNIKRWIKSIFLQECTLNFAIKCRKDVFINYINKLAKKNISFGKIDSYSITSDNNSICITKKPNIFSVFTIHTYEASIKEEQQVTNLEGLFKMRLGPKIFVLIWLSVCFIALTGFLLKLVLDVYSFVFFTSSLSNILIDFGMLAVVFFILICFYGLINYHSYFMGQNILKFY